ncbi:hypothetical protein Tco_1042184 [Tanacetum coccineum]|uniref:Reverse transcriptase zinc-binding domain-containing protein n=1 Tax=Tanacetum coccineum TaxID=301880 RepID=A0ABQ5GJ23_9ASTR
MEKFKRRVNDWKNKSLSFMGRTQLIRSVFGSMHVYWASVFILPTILMLVMRGFLWCQGEIKKGKAKVAWEVVCLPRKEGGLGIRRLEIFNKALIASHIWSLLSDVLGLAKDLASPSLGPLSNIVSNRNIYSAGFRKDSKVYEIIHHDAWTWPNDWLVKYPILVNVASPLLSEATDSLGLIHLNKDMSFLVDAIWECIRPRFNEIEWFHVVWFSHQIPRHAIHLWLVIKRKLKTQDLLRHWDVWENLKRFTCINNLPWDLNSIVNFLIPLAKMRSIRSVICKLVFAASCYFIWQERKYRLFKKVKRTHD